MELSKKLTTQPTFNQSHLPQGKEGCVSPEANMHCTGSVQSQISLHYFGLMIWSHEQKQIKSIRPQATDLKLNWLTFAYTSPFILISE